MVPLGASGSHTPVPHASASNAAAAKPAYLVESGPAAGVIAAAGASGMGYVLAVKVLNVSYNLSPLAWLFGIVLGGAGIALAGYLGTRRVLSTPPMLTLRELA